MPSVQLQAASNGNSASLELTTAIAGSGNITFMGWLKLNSVDADNGGNSVGLQVNVASGAGGERSLQAFPSGPSGTRRLRVRQAQIDLYETAVASTAGWMYVVIHRPTSGSWTVRFFADDSGMTLLGTLSSSVGGTQPRFVGFASFGVANLQFRTTSWKVFDGGSFTDSDCRAQAASRETVTKSGSTLVERWALTSHTALTGAVSSLALTGIADGGASITTISDDEPTNLTPPKTLTITQAPTTGTSGVALSPSLVVTSSDSGFTGNVTIEKVSGDPTIGGTLTVAAVAGVATFANVIPSGTGSLVPRATAAGHDPVTFDAITVNAPAGTSFNPRLH